MNKLLLFPINYNNQKMICGYCPGPKQTTYEEFCAFIEKREAENKQQIATTTKQPRNSSKKN